MQNPPHLHAYAFDSVTLDRLHRYTATYEDPNLTVQRILDQLEAKSDPGKKLLLPQAVRTYPEGESPDLRFTSVQSARVDGRLLDSPKWNSVMAMLCGKAIATRGLDWMQARKTPRVVPGKRTVSGFHHLPSSDASVQYTDATKAWGYIESLARELGVEVVLAFRWRQREEAQHPGERGRLEVRPA